MLEKNFDYAEFLDNWNKSCFKIVNGQTIVWFPEADNPKEPDVKAKRYKIKHR